MVSIAANGRAHRSEQRLFSRQGNLLAGDRHFDRLVRSGCRICTAVESDFQGFIGLFAFLDRAEIGTEFKANENATLGVVGRVAGVDLNVAAVRNAGELDTPIIRMVVAQRAAIDPVGDGAEKRRIAKPCLS
ncbi:hypothetical protein, partial [Sphingomonas sp. 37zxx]|uniref:hypothetical protein n=1 Tax=Sphingomonas sp. 37zxx TaxID=1550073 RepID=UPI001E357B3C